MAGQGGGRVAFVRNAGSEGRSLQPSTREAKSTLRFIHSLDPLVISQGALFTQGRSDIYHVSLLIYLRMPWWAGTQQKLAADQLFKLLGAQT